jgi:hypothetical protein
MCVNRVLRRERERMGKQKRRRSRRRSLSLSSLLFPLLPSLHTLLLTFPKSDRNNGRAKATC